MKNIIKLFVPPIILSFFGNKNNIKEYASYSEALYSSTENSYSNKYLVDLVIRKNILLNKDINSGSIKFDLSVYRTLSAIFFLKNKPVINVLDFGGGAGHHYAVTNLLIGDEKKINWAVIETKSMAIEAKKQITLKGLDFFCSINEAKKHLGMIDMVFTSSALQYCEDPLKVLYELMCASPEYIFITKTPFIEDVDKLITIQSSYLSDNGPGSIAEGDNKIIKCPITYINRSKIEDLLQKKYKVIMKIDEGSGGFEFPGRKISMTGYVCKRINEHNI